ncbi:RloB family protein [Flavobacterium phycosphaerae]|jgi:hypothetical protein|uniref:RloB family protein n=1 Tax=Flavobacterium phycosphaerae TaxID=2697515 RepID=UPI00138AE390|nr:RloB family protein [Flavobacterium phycosphaerae]
MRKRNRVSKKPVLFIACEGTSTEFNYFTSWGETEEALDKFERVEVYPDENENNPQTNPYQLFQIAKNALDSGSADYAWAVFDKDNHPRLPDTFTDAAAAGVNIAFSSRSFEEWVLMHFEKNNTTFNATECKNANGRPTNCGSHLVPNCTPIDCLTGYIRRNNYIPGYSKKSDFDLFTAIHQNTEVALTNSAWLRFQVGASINVAQPPLHNLNPYTNVDQLIYQFLPSTLNIEWGNANTNIQLNNWTINTRLDNGDIVVNVSHTQPNPQILNALFLDSLVTTDDSLNETPGTVINNQYLTNNNGSNNQILRANDVIEYRIQNNNQQYFLFKNDNTRIFITLY